MERMAILVCNACDRVLTRVCRVGEWYEHEAVAVDRAPAVPVGVFVELGDEVTTRVTGPDGALVEIKLVSPAGAIAANPDDVIEEAVNPCGRRNGCCGPDGMDGPNLSCLCGQEIATEWGDCWTQAEVRFLPQAVELRL
jgi:hypothetical protein